MKWQFLICIFLVSAVPAKPRSKRSFGYIKSIFVNKLFGSNEVVIAQPVLTKNETYQLFKIPGFNDILIKVSRKKKQKPHSDEAKPAKLEDALIVKPEVAIIGSYLGTTTERETLLAIEMVKSLINSGILSGRRDSSIQEFVVPVVPQPPRLKYFEDQNEPLNVYEEGNVLVPMRMQQMTPVQAKYSYKQKGPEMDTTYESQDGKDVIVTRTEKEPSLPQYIKVRIAEAANIGANPSLSLRVNGDPIPYYVNPGMAMPDYVQEPVPYLSHRIPQRLRNGAAQYTYGGSLNPTFLPEQMHIDSSYIANNMKVHRCKEKSTIKICPHEKLDSKTSNSQNTVSNSNKPKEETAADKTYAKEGERNANNKIAVNELLKNHTVNGQIVSQYAYKQINLHNENNTEVRIGEAPQLEGIGVEISNKDLQKDYVFIPPKGIDSPMLSVLGLNNEPGVSKVAEQDDKNAFISKTTSNKVGQQFIPSLKSNPIVVTDQLNSDKIEKYSVEENAKTNEDSTSSDYLYENNKRGDIPEVIF